MRGPALRWVVAVALIQAALAVGSYGLMLIAERSGLGLFSRLERALVFVDVSGYYVHANRTFAGQIPYREDMIEYPILALPFLYAPRLLTRSQGPFVALFALEMLAFNLLLVGAVAARVAKAEGISEIGPRLIWLTLFFACVGSFVIGRYDVVPALLGLAAACTWFGGKPETGGLLAATGTLVKVAPGAVGAIGILKELSAFLTARFGARQIAASSVAEPGGEATSSRIRGTPAFVATLSLGLLIWFWIGRGGVLQSLQYHSGRGIEIGSVASGLLWIDAVTTGARVEIVYGHQSLNLVTSHAAAWSRIAIVLQGMMIAAVALTFLRCRASDPVRFAGAATVAFVVGGKVLSPQYLIWLMPFAAVIGGKAGRVSRPLFLLASLLTAVLYPWGTRGLRDVEAWAFVALNARNLALMLVFLCWLGLPSDEGRDRPANSDASAVL